jgi:hypothetical protein
MKNTKSVVIIMILLVVILAMFTTNPPEEKHKKYISNKMIESVEKKNPENGLNAFSETGKSFGIKLVEKMVTSNNYLIFSLGNIKFKDNEKVITLGIAGLIIPLIDFDNITPDK